MSKEIPRPLYRLHDVTIKGRAFLGCSDLNLWNLSHDMNPSLRLEHSFNAGRERGRQRGSKKSLRKAAVLLTVLLLLGALSVECFNTPKWGKSFSTYLTSLSPLPVLNERSKQDGSLVGKVYISLNYLVFGRSGTFGNFLVVLPYCAVLKAPCKEDSLYSHCTVLSFLFLDGAYGKGPHNYVQNLISVQTL